jgi:hypothetical protein
MKILGLLIFVSVFEVFGQATKPKLRPISEVKIYLQNFVTSD